MHSGVSFTHEQNVQEREQVIHKYEQTYAEAYAEYYTSSTAATGSDDATSIIPHFDEMIRNVRYFLVNTPNSVKTRFQWNELEQNPKVKYIGGICVKRYARSLIHYNGLWRQ